jgi:hypothetical protein
MQGTELTTISISFYETTITYVLSSGGIELLSDITGRARARVLWLFDR